jgi:addiction module HigA family antidote
MTPREVLSHPGEVLVKVLAAMKMSQAGLARRTGLSVKHINQICKSHVRISAQVAVLLEEAVGEGAEAETWMWFQVRYDVAVAREARLDEKEAERARAHAVREQLQAILSEGGPDGAR